MEEIGVQVRGLYKKSNQLQQDGQLKLMESCREADWCECEKETSCTRKDGKGCPKRLVHSVFTKALPPQLKQGWKQHHVYLQVPGEATQGHPWDRMAFIL